MRRRVGVLRSGRASSESPGHDDAVAFAHARIVDSQYRHPTVRRGCAPGLWVISCFLARHGTVVARLYERWCSQSPPGQACSREDRLRRIAPLVQNEAVEGERR